MLDAHKSSAATENMRNVQLAKIFEATASCASLIASFSVLIWMLRLCQHGVDFTDEGFYLNWIAIPQEYRASISQFGFVYNPLFRLVGQDIVLLRQANVLIIFCCAFLLSLTTLHTLLASPSGKSDGTERRLLAPALVIASGALTFFDLWLPTPNYNSLTFVSLMVTSIGVLLTSRALARSSVGGWVVVGAGGALAFLAKPPAAALLGALVLAFTLAVDKFSIRGLLASILTALLILILVALAVDGSLRGFVARMQLGFELSTVLAAGQSLGNLFHLDGLTLSREQRVNFGQLLVLAYVMIVLTASARSALRIASATIAAIASAGVVGVSLGWMSPTISYEPFQPLLFCAILFATVVAALLFSPWRRALLSREILATTAFFVVLPYVYALGTNNNYWQHGARAGFFWLMAAVVLKTAPAAKEGPLARWRLTPVLAAALVATTGILFASAEHPYRQIAPLRMQNTASEFGSGNQQLLLNSEAAAYVRNLRTIAAENGFALGRPVIDLSGVSPGAIYALGGKPPGVAWLSAGYPGSSNFLKAALANVGCAQLASSWLLTEPGSPDSFSFDVLSPFGIDVLRDYKEVGVIQSVRAFAPVKFEQRLYKPVRDLKDAVDACERARAAKP
ncbi:MULTISPECIES: hypothetical protein [unclassified Bradyrhizobium]|uniref:hypothetical protein n=1 Tax=unclassified Bradyrhizobium TaxID=2631580 RepID=UPI002479A806|nr:MULTISPECIES: hypothetical protein [unclassified Bradyrhizobium]WGR73871.1 hypothetical protein MTX24_14105 [Bradyrhizobium sp. ISRA426]WGR78708.1 hypothetical protein MTX21_39075 [Bradyrhizobium sp. ISRA430]WGR89110.1 hypothetical protein MTX25_14120 [Bradyrhizobium sp. ISRA432]